MRVITRSLSTTILYIFFIALGHGLFAEDFSGKTLIVGSEEEFPPFSIGQTDDTAGGFTVELWKAVASESKLKYKIRVASFGQILQEFKDRKIDVLINLAQSQERRQFSSFSVPHVTVNGAIFVQQVGRGITSEADLAKRPIIVLRADLAHDYALAKGWGKNLVLADNAAGAFKLLDSKPYQHGAVMISKLVGMKTLRDLNMNNIRPLDIRPGFSQKFSFAVHKESPDLLATINESILLVKLNGTYDAIYERWFGIYDEKKILLRDSLVYLSPLAIILLALLAYILHKRRIEFALREANERLEGRVLQRTQELEVAKLAAESSNHAKGQFLANMSHEIRTPMNAIVGMAYLALKTNLDAKQRDYVEKIQISSKHLLGIINDILDFSKIDAGKLNIERINFDLKTVLQNLMDQILFKANEKGVSLHLEVDSCIPRYLCGDPLRLSQILINFANNAIKFTDAGEITIRAKELESSAVDSLIRFEVEDSGVGMTEEEQAKLFQTFQQADTSTTRKYGGTGLGLAICKQLVALKGGSIGVDSRQGKGSTFWFSVRLGLGRAPLEMDGVSGGIAPTWVQGARILLAEDNLFNLQVATDMLEDAGAVVVVASNGLEALSLLRNTHFDCVLMDIQMPEMDGLEAIRRIRAEPIWQRLPVIAMTANAREEDRAQYLAAGMDDFVSKPIKPEAFFATLRKWLKVPLCVPLADHNSHRTTVTDLRAASLSALAHKVNGKIIDLSILAKICGDHPDRVDLYATAFLQSVQQSLAEAEIALAHGNLASLSAIGHRVRTSAKAVGADALSDVCLELEGVKVEDDMLRASVLIGEMSAIVKIIAEHLDQCLGKRCLHADNCSHVEKSPLRDSTMGDTATRS